MIRFSLDKHLNGQGLLSQISKYLGNKFLLYFFVWVAINQFFSATILARAENSLWQEPINLSRSGIAANPVLILTDEGDFHVFWQDPFIGYVYTQQNNGTWELPVPVNVPFTEPAFTSPQTESFTGFYRPILVPGADGRLHAFWRNNNGALLYSQATIATITGTNNWSSVQQVAESAVAWDAVFGEDGRLHLGYIRTARSEGFPTGVYYRYSDDNGATWNSANLVYSSDYLRPLTQDQARIQIATSDDTVGLVWDNPLINQVLYSSIADDEPDWQPPTVVDSRNETDDSEAAGPSGITLIANQNEFHLLWRAQQQVASCLLYHRVSQDKGLNWEEPQIVFEAPTCAEDYDWVNESSSPRILSISMGQIVYLQAWDGEMWSQPQLQSNLSEIIDPITYRRLDLGCHQGAVNRSGKLFILACSIGDLADIWWFESPLPEALSWFPTEEFLAWQVPRQLTETEEEIQTPALVIDSTETFRLFWLQTIPDERVVEPQGPVSKIFYTFWVDESWSRPVPVIQLPEKADKFSVTIAADDRLSAVWRNPATNTYFLTQVDVANAWLPADWSIPIALEWHPLISSPFLLSSPNGSISITYAVPINEGRGIYLIHQNEESDTWADPNFVFDAAQADWDMVGEPHMAITDNGDLHILFTRYAMQPVALPIGLYYVHSQDGGQTWSNPEVISEGRILVSQLFGVTESTLLVTWQEEGQIQSELRFRASVDSGNTWGPAERISSADVNYGAATIFPDAVNQLHWLQAAADRNGQLFLREWLWDGERWQSLESQILGVVSDSQAMIDTLTGAIDSQGRLVVLYVAENGAHDVTGLSSKIFFSERVHELPTGDAISVPIATQSTELTPSPEPNPLLAIEVTPELEEFPTPDPSFMDVPIVPPSSNSLLMNIVKGIVPAILLIIVVFGLSFWVTRAGKP